MFAASSTSRGKGGVGKSRFSHPSLAYGDPKHIGQLVESILDEKPKALSKVLRKKSLDVNIFCRFEDHVEKMTPLHYSALKGKSEIARTLLMSKLCSVDLQTPFDEATALHFACRIPDSSTAFTIVSDLLVNGADVNILDHWEKTALIWASELGHAEVVRLLLSRQANVDHCCKIENPPETDDWPQRFPSPQIEHLYKDQYYGNNALIQASRFNHMEIVKILISSGCSVNAKNMRLSTALHAAAGCHYNHTLVIPQTASAEVTRHLVNSGARLNDKDQCGFTPVARSLLVICEICRLNVSTAEKVHPLLEALLKVQLLIKAGSNVTESFAFYSGPRGKMTLLSHLMNTGKGVLSTGCQLIKENLPKTVEMLILCGCRISSEDVQLAAGLKLPALTQLVLCHYEKPLSLKELCLICVRNHTKLPLKVHIKELDLPTILIKNLSLE